MPDYTPQLQALMRSRNIVSYKQLCEQTGIPEKQLRRLRRGEIKELKLSTLHRLSQELGIEIADCLAMFDPDRTTPEDPHPLAPSPAGEGEQEDCLAPSPAGEGWGEGNLQKEYDRLQLQLTEQRQTLQQEFQQESLQILEPWLIQWSAAAYAAQQNPQAPAVKLLPLLRPIEQLLQHWEIEATAIVGSEIPYDPQQHQLMGGTAEPGQMVRVRYAGYRQRDRLLHRAKVSPI